MITVGFGRYRMDQKVSLLVKYKLKCVLYLLISDTIYITRNVHLTTYYGVFE